MGFRNDLISSAVHFSRRRAPDRAMVSSFLEPSVQHRASRAAAAAIPQHMWMYSALSLAASSYRSQDAFPFRGKSYGVGGMMTMGAVFDSPMWMYSTSVFFWVLRGSGSMNFVGSLVMSSPSSL